MIQDLLTIVIPCKNEEKYIDNVILSISMQTGLGSTKIIVSDAGSTDNTLNIIDMYKNTLNISVIEGGLPAIGRNNGAKISKTKYILFIDADAEIFDIDMILKSVEIMEYKDLDLLAAKLNSDHFAVKILYKVNNLLMTLSKFDKPFAVGMYMMMRSDKFNELGGFPEDVMHCEDYLLSKRVDKDKFDIIKKDVFSDNRRFKKMGYWGMVKYIFKNTINRNNYDYFKKDVNYWK